jgi:hypothetical protein
MGEAEADMHASDPGPTTSTLGVVHTAEMHHRSYVRTPT